MKIATCTFMMVLALFAAGCIKEPVNPDEGSFQDSRDGQLYSWIRIGEQDWMTNNLAYLPAVSPVAGFSDTEPYYYVYGYEGSSSVEARAASNYTRYGVLYNWEAARAACPAGWHLPGDEEWKLLETFLGMSRSEADSAGLRNAGLVGTKLKSTSGWDNNGIGDNSSGFTALPGGYRSYAGRFEGIGLGTGYWTASEYHATTAWYRGLGFYTSTVQRYYYSKSDGFSVRCLRD